MNDLDATLKRLHAKGASRQEALRQTKLTTNQLAGRSNRLGLKWGRGTRTDGAQGQQPSATATKPRAKSVRNGLENNLENARLRQKPTKDEPAEAHMPVLASDPSPKQVQSFVGAAERRLRGLPTVGETDFTAFPDDEVSRFLARNLYR